MEVIKYDRSSSIGERNRSGHSAFALLANDDKPRVKVWREWPGREKRQKWRGQSE